MHAASASRPLERDQKDAGSLVRARGALKLGQGRGNSPWKNSVNIASISGRASSFLIVRLFMACFNSLSRQAFRQALPRAAKTHVYGCWIELQNVRNLVRVILQRVAQSQYFSVRGGKLLQLFSQLSKGFLTGHAVEGHRLVPRDAVHGLRRLRAEATKGALGVILGQVPRDPQQPGTRVDDIAAVLPLLPQAQEGFLHDVERNVSVEPASVNERPHFAAMTLVDFFKCRLVRGLFWPRLHGPSFPASHAGAVAPSWEKNESAWKL